MNEKSDKVNEQNSTPSCYDCFLALFNMDKFKKILYNPNIAHVGSRCGVWTIGSYK